MNYFGVIYTRSISNIAINPAPTTNNGGLDLSVNNSGQVDYEYYKVNPNPSEPLYFNVSPAINDYIPNSQSFAPTTIANVLAGTNTMQTDLYTLNQIDRYRNGVVIGAQIGTEYYWVGLKGYRDNDPTITDNFYTPISHEVFINDFYSAYYDVNKPVGNIYMLLGYYQESRAHKVDYKNNRTGVVITIDLAENKLQQIPYVHPDNIQDGNSVTIRYWNSPPIGTPSWITLKECIFYPKQECKYTPVTCDFISKFGVWKRLFFYKASYLNLEMTNQTMKISDFGINQNRTFGTQGSLSIKVNTDWVGEEFNQDLIELMTSENILIDGVPARMKTKSTELHRNINNKTINYTLEFDFNSDIIRKSL